MSRLVTEREFTILDVPPKSIITFTDGSSSSIGDLRRRYNRRQLLKLQRKVRQIRGNAGPARDLQLHLPVTPSYGHAFLIGLFFGSGGLCGRELHFATDPAVISWMSRNLTGVVGQQPITRRRRRPTGARIIGFTDVAVYSKILLAILCKFGLEIVKPQRIGSGRWRPSRDLHQNIPNWIRRDEKLMHWFVEGYLSSMRCSSAISQWNETYYIGPDGKEHKHSTAPWQAWSACFHVRFMGLNQRMILKFAAPITKHLKEHDGIDGAFGRMRNDGRRAFHYSYDVDTRPMLRQALDRFMLLRPAVRARMRLAGSQNKIILRALRTIRPLDSVVLGLMIERKHMTQDEFKLEIVRPDSAIKDAFNQLTSDGWLQRTGVTYTLQPKRYVESILRTLNEQMKEAEALQRKIAAGYPRLCRPCRHVSFSATCEICHVLTEPASRGLAYLYASPHKTPIVRELQKIKETWAKWEPLWRA